MWEIHTFGNGDVIVSVLTGIRLLMMTGPYIGLLLLGSLLLALLAIGRVPFDGGQKLLPLFSGAILIFFISTQIPVDVLVVDEVNPDVGDQVVQGVPIAVALPAYMSGYAGWKFTSLVETAFGIPITYNGGKATMNRVLFDLQKILGAEIRDGDLEDTIESYLVYCVFPEFDADPPVAGAPTLSVLQTAPIILPALVTTNTARSVARAGTNCADYYATKLLPKFTAGSPGYDKSRKYLQTQLQVTGLSPEDDAGLADEIISDVLPVAGQAGVDVIDNVMIFKAWIHAMTQYNALYQNVTTSVADLEKSLTMTLKQQGFSTSLVIQKMVPMLRTMIEGIVYLATPIVLVLALSPGMGAVLGLYVKLFLWLQTWGPLYAIINLVVYQEGKVRLSSMTAAGGFGSVNLSSYDSYVEFVSMLNSAAGEYIWMVPAVGWALVWGGSSLGSALSGAGRTAQATGSQLAGEFAAGRGQTMMEGQGMRWESQLQLADGSSADGVIGHSAGSRQVFAPVPGSYGISTVDQVGNMSMRGQDGSVTSLAANGSMTVQSPYGTYSKDPNGKLVSGVFRGKVFDPETGRTMLMQQEVRGDEIFSRGVYRDASGMEHQVEQVQNQTSGEQVHRLDSFKSAGFEGEEETFSDGTKLFKTKRTGSGTLHTPMSGDISGEMVQEDTYIKQPGVDGGYRHVAGTAHQVSKPGGEKKYSIARPGGSGEKEDIMNRPGTAFVVAGTDSNVVERNRLIGRGLSEKSVEGYGAIVGGVKGAPGVVVKDLNGHEFFLEGAKFSGDGELDKNGMPKEGSTVTAEKETGTDRIQATGKMVKGSESGQLVMQASSLTLSRKIGGESSGQETLVPLANGNFLVFKGGDISYKGNPYDPKTPYDYKGIVFDPQTGIETTRNMHFDGQKLVSSSGSGGETQQLVVADGSSMKVDGNMYSSGGATYTWSWPIQKGLVQVGKDAHGHPIVEERAYSRMETGSIKATAEEGIRLSNQNTTISEDSSRGQSKLSGSVFNMEKGSLVGKDKQSLQPPIVDSDGHVQISAQRVPVFVPSSGDESSQVRERGLGVGMKGEVAERNLTKDPSTGAVAREKIEGGKSSNFYIDETKIHAEDEGKSTYGHWILEAARASKSLDSQAMADKYGEWAGSLGDIVKLEGFDPDNLEHKGRLLMALEQLDKVENVAEKALMYGVRFGAIFRAAEMAKRSRQGQSARGVMP